MLKFEPAQLIASDGAASPSITPADAAALESICDYSPSFDAAKLPHDKEARVFTVSTGDKCDFKADVLATHSTRYPWAAGRLGTAAKACDLMKLRSRKLDGTPHPGVMVALPDAIGCAHEMNGYRNDVAGRIEQFGNERGLQITAVNTYEGLKVALKQHALDAIEQPWQWSREQSATRLTNVRASGASAEQAALQEDLCRRWEQDAQARTPSMLAQQRSVNIERGAAAYQADQSRIDASVAKSRQSHGPQVQAKREALADNAAAAQWQDCQAHLNPQAAKAFRDKWHAFTAEAAALIDNRTTELIKWLEASALITTLQDYDPGNPQDGVAFEDAIGSAIMGMGSSKAGAAKIDAWVNEMQASKTNLLWRAIAQNQTEGIAEVNAALKHAYAAPTLLAAKAWEAAKNDVKWNKVADLAKKSLGVFNANEKALNDKTAGMIALGNTRGLDRILATTGHRLLKPLATVGDTVNELMLQTFLVVRAGAQPQAALALAGSQLKFQVMEREEFVHRLRNNTHDLTDAAKARQAELGARWKGLREAADVADAAKGNFNAARDARIALVVTLFEGLN